MSRICSQKLLMITSKSSTSFVQQGECVQHSIECLFTGKHIQLHADHTPRTTREQEEKAVFATKLFDFRNRVSGIAQQPKTTILSSRKKVGTVLYSKHYFCIHIKWRFEQIFTFFLSDPKNPFMRWTSHFVPLNWLLDRYSAAPQYTTYVDYWYFSWCLGWQLLFEGKFWVHL